MGGGGWAGAGRASGWGRAHPGRGGQCAGASRGSGERTVGREGGTQTGKQERRRESRGGRSGDDRVRGEMQQRPREAG